MGQQPNIELDPADLPPPEPSLEPPRRWTPTRPGDITSPAEVPHGPAFGRPGPDPGWALRLVRQSQFERGPRPDDLEAMVATIAGARAARHGRGPVAEDVEVALTVLGLRPDALPEEVAARLHAHRERWLDHAAHERVKGTAVLAALGDGILADTPAAAVQLLDQSAPSDPS